ncbi:MAG: hypothetical protein ACLUAR_09095 [Pilosibacter sp.]
MESDRLLVLYPQKRGPEKERSRMDEVLRVALDGIDAEIVEDMEILEQDPSNIVDADSCLQFRLGKSASTAVTTKFSPGCGR